MCRCLFRIPGCQVGLDVPASQRRAPLEHEIAITHITVKMFVILTDA